MAQLQNTIVNGSLAATEQITSKNITITDTLYLGSIKPHSNNEINFNVAGYSGNTLYFNYKNIGNGTKFSTICFNDGTTSTEAYAQITCGTVNCGSINCGTIKSAAITAQGDISAGQNVVSGSYFSASSDKRLKENILPLELKKSILDLNVYKFDFINGAKNQVGCIAQELQEICPELVDIDDTGYLSVKESKLVYLLLEEVKKLKAEVEVLKDKK